MPWSASAHSPGARTLAAHVASDRRHQGSDLRFERSEQSGCFGEIVLSVTTSIGVTAVATEVCEKQLLAVADAALYQAKSDGRNRTAVL
jgi:PleD family two-component response regulator